MSKKFQTCFPREVLHKFTWRSTFHSLFLHVSSVNMRAHKFHSNKHVGALARNIRDLLSEVFQILHIREQKKCQGAMQRNIRENRNYYYYCYYCLLQLCVQESLWKNMNIVTCFHKFLLLTNSFTKIFRWNKNNTDTLMPMAIPSLIP